MSNTTIDEADILIAVSKNALDTLTREVRELTQLVQNIRKEDAFQLNFDVQEAARYLKMSVRHLHMLKDEGKITFSQYGRHILFTKEDLDAWIVSNRV